MQTCVEAVKRAEYAAPQKPIFSMSGKEPLDEALDPRSRLRQYVVSKRRLVAKKLCYTRPTRRSWPLKQACMEDISQLKEDLDEKITTWQRQVDLKLMFPCEDPRGGRTLRERRMRTPSIVPMMSPTA